MAEPKNSKFRLLSPAVVAGFAHHHAVRPFRCGFGMDGNASALFHAQVDCGWFTNPAGACFLVWLAVVCLFSKSLFPAQRPGVDPPRQSGYAQTGPDTLLSAVGGNMRPGLFFSSGLSLGYPRAGISSNPH